MAIILGKYFGILAATIVGMAIFAAPRPAAAQMHCCCDPDYAVCAKSPIMSGLQGAPGFKFSPSCPPTDNLTLTEWRMSASPQYQDCSAWVNPNAAADIAAAEDEAKARSWLRLILNDELIPKACRIGNQSGEGPNNEACTLRDLLQILVNISRAILAVLGSAAFAMFIYGGLMWLISGGSQERVTKGKTIITNAVFGILIVFISWTVINFVVTILSAGQGGIGEIGNIFNQQWNRGP